MRILALVPGGISDQLLFFPALDDIKRAYPKAEIGVVVEPKATPAYRVSKIVDTVIPFSYSAAKSPSDWANLLGIVRDREYEVVLSADTTWNTGLMLWLSGIPTRIAYKSTKAPYFYTATVSSSASYQADRYHDLLGGIDMKTAAPALAINVPEADIKWADALRDRLKLKEGYVLMYPGPTTAYGDQQSSYPIAGWQALIKDFREKQPDMPIALLQTDDSSAQVNLLKSQDAQLLVTAAQNLGQSAALIAGANLMIAPDSHIMQLSVALKVFTLVLFGKNKPEEMLPTTEGEETRFLGLTSDSRKIADIKPEAVLQKVWGG